MITKRLVVKNGSYQKDGEEKTRWLQIGAVHEHDGREYITLDRHINLGALPTREGDTRVFVSMFDEDGQKDAAPARRTTRGVPKQPTAADFDDEVPFMRPISPDGLCMPGDTGAWFGPHFSHWTLGSGS